MFYANKKKYVETVNKEISYVIRENYSSTH